MGWASGSELAEDCWELVRQFVPENKKKAIARKFIKLFEQQDCDTMESGMTLCKDADVYQ